jgi:hypothetical protein
MARSMPWQLRTGAPVKMVHTAEIAPMSTMARERKVRMARMLAAGVELPVKF